MNNNVFSILHISDLHKDESCNYNQLLDSLKTDKDKYQSLGIAPVKYIVVSGDLVHGSNKDDVKEACNIGSIIRPSCKIWMIPPASPTTIAADKISLAPSRNNLMMLSVSLPAAYPVNTPIARKIAEISGRYQPCPITPIKP